MRHADRTGRMAGAAGLLTAPPPNDGCGSVSPVSQRFRWSKRSARLRSLRLIKPGSASRLQFFLAPCPLSSGSPATAVNPDMRNIFGLLARIACTRARINNGLGGIGISLADHNG
jgi:hypothetical protein